MPTPWEFIFLIQEGSLGPCSPLCHLNLLLPYSHPDVCCEAWGWGGCQPPRQSDESSEGPFSCNLLKITQINILYLKQTKISCSLLVQLSLSLYRHLSDKIDTNQHLFSLALGPGIVAAVPAQLLSPHFLPSIQPHHTSPFLPVPLLIPSPDLVTRAH